MDAPNVLLLVLDSVRAKNMSLYGSMNETTPNIDSFSEGACVYTQARAPSIHSIASHVSIFTGHHVASHGASKHTAHIQQGATIWESLADNFGYETGLFTSNVVLTESSNLHEAFGHVTGPQTSRYPFQSGLTPNDLPGTTGKIEYIRHCLRHDQPIHSLYNGFSEQVRRMKGPSVDGSHGDDYVDSFLDWTAERNGPWAVCLNLMDAHYPYLPDSQYDQWGGDQLRSIHKEINGPLVRQFLNERPWWQLQALEALYDGCIRQLDSIFSRLVGELKRRGSLENTILVVTSDHGEGFGERSRLDRRVRLIDHNWGIAEELTHVPLIVHLPNDELGSRITDPVSLTQFPSFVTEVITGEDPSFRSDEPVLSSTYRVEPPGDELPIPERERKKYFGPWHAVYTRNERGVEKHAVKGDTTVHIQIEDAQNSYSLGKGQRKYVNDILEKVTTEKRLLVEEEPINSSVENRLEDLGYLQ
ncbi:sulfatase [Halobacteria archaeon AArc-m2/3/4]|uniref:Sulfatase n=1 Tax=Natronoglomus mannanivorans TaxID=2979990 RepID=A0ABT2QDK5_9EURY|nr:sulfatase [Halobacteria archaeon AArc-m2/3/4]